MRRFVTAAMTFELNSLFDRIDSGVLRIPGIVLLPYISRRVACPAISRKIRKLSLRNTPRPFFM